jgi:hypothetical protein
MFRLFRTLRIICYEYSMPKSHFRIPAYDGPLRRRIRLLVKANPKRGKAALRFAKYRDGMTVEEYIRACEDVGTPNYAIFDITWDTDPKKKIHRAVRLKEGREVALFLPVSRGTTEWNRWPAFAPPARACRGANLTGRR